MSAYTPIAVMVGTLRRRLLLNAVVDPDEAADRLPHGLRPHVTSTGTVVGCCLLEIEHLRPGRVPAVLGVRQRAAAHRISAEWENEEGELVVGVYVPERRTDSRLAVAFGGRCFPGVHRPAAIAVHERAAGFDWSVQGGEVSIEVTVRSCDDTPVALACQPIAATCIGANIGLSPDHHEVLEAACMTPSTRTARAVVLDACESSFIGSFVSAVPAPAYLMEGVTVAWSPVPVPRVAARGVA
jgi:hypothetical protein